MIKDNFGNRIKELRNAKLISQNELAETSGIDRTQISKIEKGKVNVTLETIEKLAKALEISVKELMPIDANYSAHPFVKWAGGKTQIINKLKELMPNEFDNYFEPFIGGGALLFSVAPKRAFISDQNSELICAYMCFSDDSVFENLISELMNHEKNHSEKYYYLVREQDKDPFFKEQPIYIRAARMIYLNKSCFNGLYRVNSKGYFNVPSAKRDKVKTFEEDNFNALREFFKTNTIMIKNQDYEKTVENAKSGDFVYFDPPYDAYPDKLGFVDYGKDGFGKEEQVRLRDCFKKLSDKGVKVMLSNHNTPFVNEIYADFNIHIIDAKRMINSKAEGRGNVQEVIVTNYSVKL